MTTDVQLLMTRLRQVTLFEYFKNRAMPEFVEPSLARLVDCFRECTDSQRAELQAMVSSEVASLFGWYARKLAGRAVREQCSKDILDGLTALAISASHSDPRNLFSPMALLYNSAMRLKEDPEHLFTEVSRSFDASIQQLFLSFVGRSIEQKSIERFGFEEGMGPQGFDYIPLLPEYGGPSPLKGN